LGSSNVNRLVSSKGRLIEQKQYFNVVQERLTVHGYRFLDQSIMNTINFLFSHNVDGHGFQSETDISPNSLYNLPDENVLPAVAFNSGFSFAHDTYNGIFSASDGKIYYTLSSANLDNGGKMYSFDL
jgi:hypothetical protein